MAETDSKILALLHNIAKEQNLENYSIKVKPISSGGANYTSILFIATITSENKDDLHLFIKVASMGETFRNATFNMYEVEKFIYTELKNNFSELEKKHGVPEKNRLGMSEYYGASTVTYEEMLVLENLLTKGFECHDRMKSVDWEYAAASITELAKLHALSMALQHYKPDEFKKAKQILNNVMTSNEDMDMFWSSCKKTALGAVREENRERLHKFLDAMDFDTYWRLYEPFKREVLMHGDFRPSNLMHRRRDDGSIEVIAVDYQGLRSGSAVVDLLYFIITATDAKFRAHYYQKLLDHYFSELRAALTRLGLNPDEKYSKEDFELELKEKLPFGLVSSVFILPIVTVEEENAPKVDEGMELSGFSSAKTSSLFTERLNEVVDDYVRWGVL